MTPSSIWPYFIERGSDLRSQWWDKAGPQVSDTVLPERGRSPLGAGRGSAFPWNFRTACLLLEEGRIESEEKS